jgi:Uma2 family endonuclease
MQLEPPKSAVGRQAQVLATGVSFEDYLENYAHDYAELIDGVVIQMSPVELQHDAISRFLENLFEAYLTLAGGGLVLQAPVVMKMGTKSREPDLMVLLPEQIAKAKRTYVDGAADLVVEIVSTESVERDRGDKFIEYEQAGVKEYWIIDPLRKETLFYELSDEGIFQRRNAQADGSYTSRALPKLRLNVGVLWQDPLPDVIQAVKLVQAMFTGETE